MRYREMTDEQRLEWGFAESDARKHDLKDRSDFGLQMARILAEKRRKAIGATQGQATDMVLTANRARRVSGSSA